MSAVSLMVSLSIDKCPEHKGTNKAKRLKISILGKIKLYLVLKCNVVCVWGGGGA